MDHCVLINNKKYEALDIYIVLSAASEKPGGMLPDLTRCTNRRREKKNRYSFLELRLKVRRDAVVESNSICFCQVTREPLHVSPRTR